MHMGRSIQVYRYLSLSTSIYYEIFKAFARQLVTVFAYYIHFQSIMILSYANSYTNTRLFTSESVKAKFQETLEVILRGCLYIWIYLQICDAFTIFEIGKDMIFDGSLWQHLFSTVLMGVTIMNHQLQAKGQSVGGKAQVPHLGPHCFGLTPLSHPKFFADFLSLRTVRTTQSAPAQCL